VSGRETPITAYLSCRILAEQPHQGHEPVRPPWRRRSAARRLQRPAWSNGQKHSDRDTANSYLLDNLHADLQSFSSSPCCLLSDPPIEVASHRGPCRGFTRRPHERSGGHLIEHAGEGCPVMERPFGAAGTCRAHSSQDDESITSDCQ